LKYKKEMKFKVSVMVIFVFGFIGIISITKKPKQPNIIQDTLPDTEYFDSNEVNELYRDSIIEDPTICPY